MHRPPASDAVKWRNSKHARSGDNALADGQRLDRCDSTWRPASAGPSGSFSRIGHETERVSRVDEQRPYQVSSKTFGSNGPLQSSAPPTRRAWERLPALPAAPRSTALSSAGHRTDETLR